MFMEPIYSLKNPRIKEWAALKQKKFRNQAGQYIIEGIRLVEEAFASKVEIVHVLYGLDRPSERIDQLVEHAESLGIPIVECTEQVLAQVADTQTPQGIIAIAKKPEMLHSLDKVDFTKPILCIDGIQDPGNLGTIIRTADAVDASCVIVSSHSADPFQPKVVRSTMGSLFHMPVIELDMQSALETLRNKGLQIFGSSSHLGHTYYEVNLQIPHVLVFGNEAHGISEQVESYIDQWIHLPMIGKAESLNVAIAASVIMYEVTRQRLQS